MKHLLLIVLGCLALTTLHMARAGELVFGDCSACPEMAVIPAGSFEMGDYINGPVHRVTFAKPFAIGKTEVTQGQWQAIMGNNPSHFKKCGKNCPVENVGWDDAREFIDKLNTKTGKQYRLPTEAEWEYACRAGGRNKYCGSDEIDSVAWYGNNGRPGGNSGQTTHPVATKHANAWGLYDMTGNVFEWVEDTYFGLYDGAPTDGSARNDYDEDETKVVRGGSWDVYPDGNRAAGRGGAPAQTKDKGFGFRLAMTLQ